LAALAIGLGVALVMNPTDGVRQTEPAGQPFRTAADVPLDPRRTARETYASLAWFGQTLLEAGKTGGNIIIEKTGSPLHRGLTKLQLKRQPQNH
jgi:hypothetical protein